MSYSISTLLTRNLHDVFGENDSARRRAAIDEIFTEDCVFYEPRGVYRGRDEIDRVAGAIKSTHPDFRYQPIAGPEELGNGGRIQWGSGRPGEAPDRTALDKDWPRLYYSDMNDAVTTALIHAAQRVEERLEEVLAGVGLSCAKFGALGVLVGQDQPISL